MRWRSLGSPGGLQTAPSLKPASRSARTSNTSLSGRFANRPLIEAGFQRFAHRVADWSGRFANRPLIEAEPLALFGVVIFSGPGGLQTAPSLKHASTIHHTRAGRMSGRFANRPLIEAHSLLARSSPASPSSGRFANRPLIEARD